VHNIDRVTGHTVPPRLDGHAVVTARDVVVLDEDVDGGVGVYT
jgi:hypothetical protein